MTTTADGHDRWGFRRTGFHMYILEFDYCPFSRIAVITRYSVACTRGTLKVLI